MHEAVGGKIKINMDGPYEVSGNIPLNQAGIGVDAIGDAVKWIAGKTYDQIDEPYKLCRCGHSHTKPFCDGTHDDAEFCGHEHAGRPPYDEQAEFQRGGDIGLLDDPALCSGAGFCDRGATVWGYIDQAGDPESRRLAIEEACLCPSGRLTVVESDGAHIEPLLPQEISLVEDPANNCRGPLWIKGGIELEGANGEKYETRNRVTLCRCGMSTNQPYCDGNHYQCENMRGLDC